MATRRTIDLTRKQQHELEENRDHYADAYVREQLFGCNPRSGRHGLQTRAFLVSAPLNICVPSSKKPEDVSVSG